MAIEDDDFRDREVWTGVSKHWYNKASDKAPTTGRLYHHLAILARPNPLQQLFYYSKSLCVPIPFKSAKDSIKTLFRPLFHPEDRHPIRMSQVDQAFVTIIGVLFMQEYNDKLQPALDDFLGNLDAYIARSTRKWQESGYYLAITLACAVLGFGLEEGDGRACNTFFRMVHPAPLTPDPKPSATIPSEKTDPFDNFYFRKAVWLLNGTLAIVLRRTGDPNILHFAHCFLVFVLRLCHVPAALAVLAPHLQWSLIATLLNTLLMERPDLDLAALGGHDSIPCADKDRCSSHPHYRDDAVAAVPQPLPEDHAMRGLVYTLDYHPSSMFATPVDAEDKFFEMPSMMEPRKDRVLSLGFRIARLCSRINDSDGVGHCLEFTEDEFRAGSRYTADRAIESTTKVMAASETEPSDKSSVSSFSVDVSTPSCSSSENGDVTMADIPDNPGSNVNSKS